jgi:hypothetical protein
MRGSSNRSRIDTSTGIDRRQQQIEAATQIFRQHHLAFSNALTHPQTIAFVLAKMRSH